MESSTTVVLVLGWYSPSGMSIIEYHENWTYTKNEPYNYHVRTCGLSLYLFEMEVFLPVVYLNEQKIDFKLIQVFNF